MRVIIFDKIESFDSKKIKSLIGDKAIFESFKNDTIKEILKRYDPVEIGKIIFHASGRYHVTPTMAAEYLNFILKWRKPTTKVWAISDGENHLELMKEEIRQLGATNVTTDSVLCFIKDLEDEKRNTIKKR